MPTNLSSVSPPLSAAGTGQRTSLFKFHVKNLAHTCQGTLLQHWVVARHRLLPHLPCKAGRTRIMHEVEYPFRCGPPHPKTKASGVGGWQRSLQSLLNLAITMLVLALEQACTEQHEQHRTTWPASNNMSSTESKPASGTSPYNRIPH